MTPMERLESLEDQIVSDLRRDASAIAGAFLSGPLAAAVVSQSMPGAPVKVNAEALAALSLDLAEKIRFEAEARWAARRLVIAANLARIDGSM